MILTCLRSPVSANLQRQELRRPYKNIKNFSKYKNRTKDDNNSGYNYYITNISGVRVNVRMIKNIT